MKNLSNFKFHSLYSGEEALLRHVSYYMKYFASQRKMKQNSQCPGDKTDKPKPCNTRAGCFNFRALDGSLLVCSFVLLHIDTLLRDIYAHFG